MSAGECTRCGTESDALAFGQCAACRPVSPVVPRSERTHCVACGVRHVLRARLPWCPGALSGGALVVSSR